MCRMHGGSAPQVKAAAKVRLASLVDPAIGVLAANMKNRRANPGVAQRAAEDVLDRNGFKPVEKIETTQLWDGDLAKLTEDQLAAMAQYFWNFVAPEKRAELQQRTLEIEGPVIEAEFVNIPEQSVEEEGGW